MNDPPVLAMAAVVEADALLEPFEKSRFSEPSISGVMQFIENLGVLRVDAIVDDSTYSCIINIDFDQSNRRIVPYFRCSRCGKRCSRLVLDDSAFICAEDYQTYGFSGSKRARQALLRQARDCLAAIQRRKKTRWVPRERWQNGERYTDRYEAAARAVAFVRDEPSQPNLARPRSVEGGFYSTARALLHGRGALDYNAVIRYENEREGLIRRLRANRPRIPKASKTASTSETPVFDINVLVAEGSWYAAQTGLSTFTMKWPDSEPLIIIDGRGATPVILVAHNWADLGNPDWQLIETWKQHNGRTRLICPVDLTACDKLYLRNGYFASRSAHSLYHPSQRGEARPRAKARKGDSIE